MTVVEDGRVLYEFVLTSGCRDVLELGFAHGTSTCYLAAALDERADGHITSIDNQSARNRRPSLPEQLHRLGLESRSTAIYARTSYDWELMKLIEEATHETGVCVPRFDFCFIDGAHRWEPDGLAFFLVDKLLKPDGWLLFDDLPWTLDTSTSEKVRAAAKSLPVEERTTPHIERVMTLLVRQHPGYDHISVRDRWGWAHKRATDSDPASAVETLTSTYDERAISQDIRALVRKVRHRIQASSPQ
ncbi:MAG: O-methyltransferase [Jatrophihabitans sp.]